MAENNYVCPYCGQEIGEEDVLFWETVKTQYTDNIRGDFLRRHGMKIAAGNKFPRMYYRVKKGINVVREDENGFPTMIEDSLSNAIAPEDLNRSSVQADSFDDDFDSDGYVSGDDRSGDRLSRESHRIPMRACPSCHCDLPQQFGILKTYHVAMFGGRAAGKTAYLVNLFQQLSYQLGVNDLGSVDLATESKDFLEPMIADYERDGTTRPTSADSGLLPILCHYRNKGSEAFITFYDIAGEGTGNPAYMANHKGIANSEALILMVDPNMFVAGAYFAEWNANHQDGDYYHLDGGDCCKEPLGSFLNQAGELCREYSDNIKYVVCVLTKIDMMLESAAKYFSAGDIEIVSDVKDKHREAVNYSVIKRVNDNLNVFLEKQHHIRLKEKLTDTFGKEVKLNILGVSTSTLDENRSVHGEIHFKLDYSSMGAKHRIIEPFLIVMMYLGLVNVRMPDGRIVKYGAAQENRQQETAGSGGNNDGGNETKQKKHGLFGWRK